MTKYNTAHIKKRKKRLHKMVNRLKKHNIYLGLDNFKPNDPIINTKNNYHVVRKNVDFRNKIIYQFGCSYNKKKELYKIDVLIGILQMYNSVVCKNALINIVNNLKRYSFRNILKELKKGCIDDDGNIFKIEGYAKIRKHDDPAKNLNSLKALLEINIPVLGSFKLPINAVSKCVIASGILEYKWVTNVVHDVIFVGYDDNMIKNNEKGFLIFKNNWGEDWGDNGVGYLSYKYILYNKCINMCILYNNIPSDDIFQIYNYKCIT